MATVIGIEESGQVLEAVTGVVRLLRLAAAGSSSRAAGLSLTEFRLLKLTAERMRLVSELATALDVTVPTISSAVDGLVRRGLIQRCDRGVDRRAIPLDITDEGRRLLAAARRRQRQALSAVMARLDPEERRALTVAVAGLVRALGDAPEHSVE